MGEKIFDDLDVGLDADPNGVGKLLKEPREGLLNRVDEYFVPWVSLLNQLCTEPASGLDFFFIWFELTSGPNGNNFVGFHIRYGQTCV